MRKIEFAHCHPSFIYRTSSQYIVATLLVCALVQCQRETELDFPNIAPKLALLCAFEAGAPFQIALSSAHAVADSVPKVDATNTTLKLIKDGQFLENLYLTIDPNNNRYIWESNALAEKSSIYRLECASTGFPAISSTAVLPPVLPLKSIFFDINNAYSTPFSGSDYAYFCPITVAISQTASSDSLWFAMRISVEKEVYDTTGGHWNLDYITRQIAGFQTDPFSLAKLETGQENYTLVHQSFWDGQRRDFNCTAVLPYNPATQRIHGIYVEWRTCTRDGYLYWLSLARQSPNSLFAEPDALFNNISGGYGNFSGFAVQRDSILF